MPFTRLRATPDFVEFYERIIAQKLAEDDLCLRRKLARYMKAKGIPFYPGAPDKITASEDCVWEAFVQAEAGALIRLHTDADFISLPAAAGMPSGLAPHIVAKIRRAGITIILLATVAHPQKARQYVFKKDVPAVQAIVMEANTAEGTNE